MVDPPRRQIHDLGSWCHDIRGTSGVRKAHDSVGVRDIKCITDECHSERRVQSGQEHRSRVSDSISVGITEQYDPICARDSASGLALKESEEKPFDSFPVIRPLRSIRLRHKNIAIWKHVERAGMIESAREGANREPVSRDGRSVVGPRLRLDDVDYWNQRFFWRRNNRMHSRLGRYRHSGRGSAGCWYQNCQEQKRTEKILLHRYVIRARITQANSE